MAPQVLALASVPEITLAPALEEDPPGLEEEWRRRCAANPNLHDGPLVEVLAVEPGRIAARRTTYRRFVAGPAVGRPVLALGVTGVCVRGGEVLLGRRGPGVRIYGGLWETAPRGGVEPGPGGSLSEGELTACLEAEGREELGPSFRALAWRALAAVRDGPAGSLDLCFLVELAGDPGGPAAWEYDDRRWVRTGEVAGWAQGGPPPEGLAGALSPPAEALARWEGWGRW
jgi:hypothetical protein